MHPVCVLTLSRQAAPRAIDRSISGLLVWLELSFVTFGSGAVQAATTQLLFATVVFMMLTLSVAVTW